MTVKFFLVAVCFLQICLCSAYARTIIDDRPQAVVVFRQCEQFLNDAGKVVQELSSCVAKGVGDSNNTLSSMEKERVNNWIKGVGDSNKTLISMLTNMSDRITMAVGASQRVEQVVSQVEQNIEKIQKIKNQIADYKSQIESLKNNAKDVTLNDKITEEQKRLKEQDTEEFNKLSLEKKQKVLENYSKEIKENTETQNASSDFLTVTNGIVSIQEKNDSQKETSDVSKPDSKKETSDVTKPDSKKESSEDSSTDSDAKTVTVEVPQVSISESGTEQINNLEGILRNLN